MAAPADYAVTIKVNDVDVTTDCPFEEMSFEDFARQVSRFRFRIDNPSGVTPARGQTVVVIAKNLSGAPTIFDGYIIEVTTERRGGVVTDYVIEAADKKIRLQKSVLPYKQYSGLDSDILSSLLTDAYPDMSDLFDFSSDITSFADSLSLGVNEDSLLDALNELADLANADWRMEESSSTGEFTYIVSDPPGLADTVGEAAVGNPGNAAQMTIASITTSPWPVLRVTITFTEPTDVTNVICDIWWKMDPDESVQVAVLDDTESEHVTISNTKTAEEQWLARDFDAQPGGFPTLSNQDHISVQLQFTFEIVDTFTDLEYRIDNIDINDGEFLLDFDENTGDVKNKLQWDSAPDATDFNFDIQSGNEFAFDIDLVEGDWDDFNSITVVGGKEKVAIDWTYESEGQQDHINLETDIQDIAVFKNQNTDNSPSWLTLDDGIFGTDSLTDDGGTKDVLYDPEQHWLLFDSAHTPPNLTKSIRVTGNILRPIRIRVEDVNSGDPTFAISHHDDSITTTDQAVSVGQAQLEKRNSIKRLNFKTYEPGLKPGQSISVTDSARGLSETLTIQRINTRWLGSSGHALFEVECGEAEVTGADVLIANNDKRSRENALPATPTSQSAALLTTDGNPLTTDGLQLYYIE